MAQITMAWSKCVIKVGAIGSNDAFTATAKNIGTIKDKSSSLESAEGDTLEMKETGGATVGYEVGEGTMTLTTRIIEPTSAFYTLLGLADNPTDSLINVKTHLPSTEVSVMVIPQKVGAMGIKANKCTCSAKFGWSEEDGNYADVTFGIIKSVENNVPWYSRFKVTTNDLGTADVTAQAQSGS